MDNTITSLQNPKIKQALKLKKASKRRKEDLILIEGYDEIIMAMNAGIAIKTLFICPDYSGGKTPPATIPGDIINTSKEVFTKLSRREHPDGWLAMATPRYISPDKLKLSSLPLVIVLEAPEKPGNLGAVIRSADAAGADAIIVTEVKTDIYNPNVIRASRGAVFTLPAVATDNQSAAAWLSGQSIKIFAASGQAEKLYTDADFTGPAAIIIGTEHDGLSDFWLKFAEKIKIPMQGKVNSLNASVSAGILIYEALRQRANNN